MRSRRLNLPMSMRKTLLLPIAACVVALFLTTSARAAAPEPVIDQSSTQAGVTSFINFCCNNIGQTFTAGRDGNLAGVNIDTRAALGPITPLRVTIRNVEGSVPGDTVLAETT